MIRLYFQKVYLSTKTFRQIMTMLTNVIGEGLKKSKIVCLRMHRMERLEQFKMHTL